MKLISTRYALLAILCLSSVLTSCVATPQSDAGFLNIYSPDILRLQPAIPVQTVDGIYTPQTPEVWHSDKRFRELERQFLNQ